MAVLHVFVLAVSQPTVAIHVAAIAGLVGLILPLVTGLLVKKYADRRWFVLVTTALAIITGAVATLAQGNVPSDWSIWAFGMVSAFMTAITSYYGIHLPTGLASAVQNIAPTLGIGSVAATPGNMSSVARTEYVQGGDPSAVPVTSTVARTQPSNADSPPINAQPPG